MGRGYFLVRGDKTTCGGKIIEGADDHTILGIPQAREMDRVTCGRYPGMFIIVGGVSQTDIHGRLMAGSLDSQSSCPCKARFIASMMDDVYESAGGDGSGEDSVAESNEPEQHAQSAQKNLTSGSDSSSDDVKLDYSIKLSGNKILTPLDIPDYKEMINGGSTQNTEKIDFTITNKGDEAEGFSLEVWDGAERIYIERHYNEFLGKGEHLWQWDGYSNKGILDTNILKSKSLVIRLFALRGDKVLRVSYPLNNSAKQEKWVDVHIDKKSKTINVTWRLAFEEGGVKGSDDKLSPIPYADLVDMAKKGVAFYWSRNGNRGGGIGDNIVTVQGIFKVDVKTEINNEPSMSSFELTESLDKNSGRSSSLWGFREVVHNLGYYYGRYLSGMEANYIQAAESRFKLDSAHEMGHIVLNQYSSGSSPDYSWTHKGTSTEYTQEPLSGFPMPVSGEIDIMKYSDYPRPNNEQYLRAVAASEDVAALIWLSRVVFDD
ncbi:PAAR domain-containing protein [Salmonella enterica subsp. enterica]|uniref:PAAR domain-containing protein n=1 Tax=Salmonella montevideo TaxID=115981 RepID=A0A624AZR2_SALMO|nr:PAAR domain-containing protein [Salmonella enterica subsp. enterica]EAW9773968.1 PAAR domain-containing protein [Salmonella enterica]ECZ5259608.1 PAAR domain-containing protein [Salmonella enterica subsp. enterica serovar Montevideo]EBL7062444.1 PAAR domain-containing protein [Salmonella enterica]EBS8343095.1 PAAR domain-containing protein [Salmonella enterica]